MNENRVVGNDRVFMFSFTKESTALIFQSYDERGKLTRHGMRIMEGDAKESFPDVASKIIATFPPE